MQKYYQSEPEFIGAYSKIYSPKIKDGAYLDEYESIGTMIIIM